MAIGTPSRPISTGWPRKACGIRGASRMRASAPSRSGIITGMYPTTIGTHHMRCKGVPPPHVKCFTEYLRAAGYYCTNNSKTDYNFNAPLTAWDENGPKSALAEPTGGCAVFRRHQHHDHARKPGAAAR